MYAERHVVTVTTNAEEVGVGYTPNVTGRVLEIRYVKTDFAAGVDFTITAKATGETIWAQDDVDESATVAPRQATHSTAGAAALYAADGSAVLDYITLANDRVKIAIASGGDKKSGTFHVLIG